ncbi:MAG TPA: hypothetical protein VKQ36_06710 [Ktedonobacterales bacterium]|nr:hypothetical protein [Ktedonobacterales bacterium]
MLSAAKWGALVGVAIYIVSQILAVISNAAFPGAPTVNNPGAVSLGCLNLMLILFAFSAAGFYTGRETGRAGLGAIGGMVSFVVYAALLAIYSVGGRIIQSQGEGGFFGALVASVIPVILYLGLAALIGWLGGRPGATRARLRPADTTPSGAVVTTETMADTSAETNAATPE